MFFTMMIFVFLCLDLIMKIIISNRERKIKQNKKFKWTFTVLHIVISVCINLAVKKRKFFKEEFPVIVYDHSLYGYYLSLFPPKGSD